MTKSGAFRKNIFGDPEKKDSLDSLANANPQNVKAAKKAKNKTVKAKNSSVKAQKSSKSKNSPAASSSSGNARVSVRRQRH